MESRRDVGDFASFGSDQSGQMWQLGEDNSEDDEDFQKQMDENGIIGLGEEEVESEEVQLSDKVGQLLNDSSNLSELLEEESDPALSLCELNETGEWSSWDDGEGQEPSHPVYCHQVEMVPERDGQLEMPVRGGGVYEITPLSREEEDWEESPSSPQLPPWQPAVESSTSPPIPTPRKAKPPNPSVPASPVKSTVPVCSQPAGGSTSTCSSSKRYKSSRKEQLIHPLPDFSKVEPKVRFPKAVYKPPRSKSSLLRCPAHTVPIVVYKSPADIVQEVLLSSSEGHPSPSANTSTIPQEFNSPRQASALMHQLQEDYSRLLTKYAEAENTIDQLRLEAKVNLYSDPPQAINTVLSGEVSMGSKVMNLTFPQAQRGEFGSSSLTNSAATAADQTSSSCSPLVPPFLSSTPQRVKLQIDTLNTQACSFQMKLGSYEEHLKMKKLNPFQQMKSLSDLAQEQEALENAYMHARDQHRLWHMQGGEQKPFDPDREVEGQIFRCGVKMDELREAVEQAVLQRPSSALPMTPPPGPRPLSTPRMSSSPSPLPKSPVSPVKSACVSMEVSSLSEDEEEELPSILLHPLQAKQQQVECDFSTLLHHYQSFKELPGQLQPAQELKVMDSHPGDAGTAEGHSSLLTARQDTSMSTKDSHCVWGQSYPPVSSSQKSHCSSVTSLGESASSMCPTGKPQDKGRRAPPLVSVQDGVISPETDSGFVGSESSRLTPSQQAANVSTRPPVHSGEEEVKAAPTPNHLQQQGYAPIRGLVSISPHLCKGGGASGAADTYLPLSKQLWDGRESTHVSKGAHSSSEGEESHNSSYIQSTNGQKTSPVPSPHHPSQSRRPPYHCSSERNKAIQNLQEEVNRLKHQLERSLRYKHQPSLSTAPPAVEEDVTPSQSCVRKERAAKHRQEADKQGMSTAFLPRQRSGSAPCRRPELDVSDFERIRLIPKSSSSRYIPSSSSTYDGSLQARPEAVNHSSGNQSDCEESGHGGTSACNGGATASAHTRLPEKARLQPGQRVKINSGSTQRGTLGKRLFVTPPPNPVVAGVPLVHCVALYPSMLCYSSPALKAVPARTLRGARASGTVRTRLLRSLPGDSEAVGRSLERAVQTAESMRSVSDHMVRSLAAGLTQSCLY